MERPVNSGSKDPVEESASAELTAVKVEIICEHISDARTNLQPRRRLAGTVARLNNTEEVIWRLNICGGSKIPVAYLQLQSTHSSNRVACARVLAPKTQKLCKARGTCATANEAC